jgi:LPS export ABC transporter protein LptC
MHVYPTSSRGAAWRLAFAAALLIAAAGCTDSGDHPIALGEESPDRVLTNARHNVIVGGVVRMRLTADSAYIFEETQTSTLFGVRATLLADAGEIGSVEAGQATFDLRANTIHAHERVRLTRNDGGLRIEVDEAFLEPDANLIRSESPATVAQGGGSRQMSGFSTDFSLRRVEPATAAAPD